MLPNPLYLNVLPVHPRPQPLETLNSYLKRIAQANGIQHIRTFSHFIKTHHPMRLLALTPSPIFGDLQTVTQCTQEELLTLTGHFLGHKFGREQTVSKFLAHSVVQHLRWCPYCLTEQGYYQFPWHFLHIHGCPQHQCRLLDSCPHCQQQIVLKSTALALYTCPHCDGDLCQSMTKPLTDNELQACNVHWHDLVYLLTPQDWQRDPTTKVADAMRQRLGYIRRSHNLKAQQVAQILGLSKRVFGALENETQSGVGETLADYLRYADYFGLNLSDVFRESAEAGYIHKDDLYANHLLEQAYLAVARLKQESIPVTQQCVAQLLGHTPSMLRKYPEIHALLRTEALIRDKQTQAYRANLYEQTQQVIDDLNHRQQRLSKRKIALQLGYDPTKIRTHYPRVEQLVVFAVIQYQQQQAIRRAQLRQDVEQTLRGFQQHGMPITQKRVAQHLGVSEFQLANDSRIQTLIAEYKQAAHRIWFNTLKERIANEMDALLEQGVVISRTQFARRLQIPNPYFVRYSELNAMWQTFDVVQRQQREAAILEQVQEAIHTCLQQNISLTFRTVEKLVGHNRTSLKRYPSVYALLKTHNLVRT